jgi:CubicO group peptidase (beta-lactamase class C family)
MRLAPWIARERRPDGVLRLRLDDVHHPLLVGERPAQDDEAGVHEPVHEGRVRGPVGLLFQWPRRVPLGAGAAEYDVESRHARSSTDGQVGSVSSVSTLEKELDAIASETAFSGVVRVEAADGIEVAKAYGLAHRGYQIANELDTQFAIASGTKGLTALTVVSLVEEGRLDLATTARSVLGRDLPLIDDDVTVEHLLSHRSGIGDYLDEEIDLDLTDYLMPVPVYELATTEQYLAVLEGHPRKFAAGERFAYCNSGYVVLALMAERTSGVPFHDLVRQRVCKPVEMADTAFLRSDELPGRAALGYLAIDGAWRTNVFHLPVRGNGDGGIYSTAADISSLWRAFFAGEIVSTNWVREVVRARSDVPSESRRYGLGFWLHASTDVVMLEGSDAGVSFRTVHDPRTGATHTVISNTSEGAWPITRFLDERLAT